MALQEGSEGSQNVFLCSHPTYLSGSYYRRELPLLLGSSIIAPINWSWRSNPPENNTISVHRRHHDYLRSLPFRLFFISWNPSASPAHAQASPRHSRQYHSRMALAIFSVILMQSPWNHSLQLSQPLNVKEQVVET